MAVPHVKDIAYISHDAMIKLFHDAAMALERIRASAAGNTDEALREDALKAYTERSITMLDIKERLLSKKLRDLPQVN